MSSRFQNMTAAEKQKYLQRLQLLGSIPEAARQLIAQEAIDSQQSMNAQIYSSTVKFETTRTGASPYVFTCAPTVRKAFTYKIGDDLTQAGYSNAAATPEHTNLTTGGGQTNDGAEVVVWGIALEYVPGGEVLLLEQIIAHAWLELSLNSSNRNQIGKVSDYPAAGGMYGQQPSKILAGPIADERGAVVGAVSNGNPMSGNFFKLPIPFRWQPPGPGNKDTSLAITFNLSDSLVLNSSDDRPGGTGVAPFTVGAAADVYQEIRVKLMTVEIGGRSINS